MAISKCGTQLVVLSMGLVSLLTSARALACGGDWYPEVQIDPRIRGVAEAEKALSAGNYLAAAGSVVRMMPHIETLHPRGDKLVARAERVLAVAIARADGKLAIEREVPADVVGHWLGKSTAERSRNLAWSVATLRRELSSGTLKVQKDDPGLQTELGEALSKLEGGQDEARTILESLAARDLVASPQGYRALAELRQQQGDETGQQLAMKRCVSMAANSKLCESGGRRAS